VLIADDNPLFVDMVAALLSREKRIAIVGKARDGIQAIELAKRLAPDVTLMDISMPGLDGIEATKKIRMQNPDACILILTGSNAAAEVDRSRQAGAAGYLTKDRVGSTLAETILQIAAR
jgi:DNA-binding NarL/FixJ family response regulator